MKKVLTNVQFLFIVGISVISFLLRYYGLWNNHPFWVDEFSSAHQARYILEHGLGVFNSIDKPPLFFESRNIITHLLIAASFKLFGQQEWAARLPIVLIGSLVPALVFLVARRLYGVRVAVISALFTVFSYFEIVWSRQARGYVLQQFLTLATLLCYVSLPDARKRPYLLLAFLLLIVVGLATHPLYFLLLIALLIHQISVRKGGVYAFVLLLMIPLGVLLLKRGSVNNVWYYHSFLWREYGLIVFLSCAGMLAGISRKYKETSLLILYILIHLLFICFYFEPYISRYLLPVFPLFFILAGYVLTHIDFRLHKSIPVILALFIIVNGDKFVLKPKQFYSVNHDFREIALIDYSQMYNVIKSKGNFDSSKTVIVETWLDRMHWYMGQDFYSAYEFKWSGTGMTNGIKTGNVPYFIDKDGEKKTVRYTKIGLINNLNDFKKAMEKYPHGFIFIDDVTLPADVIAYAEKNLKKEFYADRYPLDDNPYSHWPATLYSWGIH